MFEEVDARRKKLDAYRPFDRETLARLDAVFEPLFIYGSVRFPFDSSIVSDSLRLPLDPESWSGSAIDRFVLDQVNGFLENMQAEIVAANA